MKKREAFTLIELIAVLVILAILALIVTPLVLNIVRKARVSADKRSIDAYGRSIELAVADYLLDTGKFPTNIKELTIEYTGDEVVCTITQLNEDGGVYLKDCKVNNRAVEGYTYGKEGKITYKSYSIGDKVTYNGADYYVLADSSKENETVTMLKAEPLTYDEADMYGGAYSGGSHPWNTNDYGRVSYYYGDKCTRDPGSGHTTTNGCINKYSDSRIKNVVDAWAHDNIELEDLSEDSTGYSARLITYEEYSKFVHTEEEITYTISGDEQINTKLVVDYPWLYNSNYSYWTMSEYQDSSDSVYFVGSDGTITSSEVVGTVAIRPVITLKKSALN